MSGPHSRSTSPRDLLTGAMLGAVAGFALGELGVTVLAGEGSVAAAILICLLLGAAGARAGRLLPLLLADSALVVLYALVAFTPVMDRLSDDWVRADTVPKQVDAIVVLSAVLHPDGALGLAGFERLATGISLSAEGYSDRIVTTRIVTVAPPQVSSDSEQGAWIRRSLPRARWEIVPTVRTTHDEAVGAAALLLPAGARQIVVVTSPMHTRRACAVFEAVGFRVYCVPAREHLVQTRHPRSSQDRLAAARAYLYERLGTVKYRAAGWIR